MELKKLRKTISEKEFDTHSDVEIKELINWLKAAEKEGAVRVEFSGITDYDGGTEEVCLDCFEVYEETSEQALARIKKAELFREKRDKEKFIDAKRIYEIFKDKYE